MNTLHLRTALAAVICCLLLTASATAQSAVDPRLAVVQIDSHGGSGTIIHSEKDKTLILTAAHMFRGRNAAPPGTPITLNVPPVPGSDFAGPRKARMRVVAVGIPGWKTPPAGQLPSDDLALIEIADGPYPAVCPVAKPGHQPGRNLWRVGYPGDRTTGNQVWPAVVVPVTVVRSDRDWVCTREPPRPGDSGGGLIDLDAGCLVGVTSWQGPVSLTVPLGGGYVPVGTIQTFLGNSGGASPPAEKAIRVIEEREGGPRPQEAPRLPIFPDLGCPDGRCPTRPGRP